MIECGYYNRLLFAEVASAILLESLLLMPVGAIKARGNPSLLELQGPSVRVWQRILAEDAPMMWRWVFHCSAESSHVYHALFFVLSKNY